MPVFLYHVFSRLCKKRVSSIVINYYNKIILGKTGICKRKFKSCQRIHWLWKNIVLVVTKEQCGWRAVSTGVLSHPTPTALAWWHSVCLPFGQSLPLPLPPPPPHLIQHWLCLPLHILCRLLPPPSPLVPGAVFHISRVHLKKWETEEKCRLASTFRNANILEKSACHYYVTIRHQIWYNSVASIQKLLEEEWNVNKRYLG